MFVFGSGVLIGFRTDVPNSTPVNFGLVQDVSIDWSFDLKEGYGQYQHPVVLGRGKAKVGGKAKVLRASGIAIGTLFFGLTPQVGQIATSFAEQQTVSVGQITVANSGQFVDDLGLVYQATGLPLAKVAAGPSAGSYSVNSGVYTLNSSDNGKAVLATYTYNIPGSGQKIVVTNQLMGYTPTFQANFFSTFQGLPITLKLPNCASSKLGFSGKLDDYTMPEFDFGIYADPTGNVGTWSFAETS